MTYCIGIMLAIMSAGCSTQKNTAGSRFYQSTVTRYNAYYNGHQAYESGIEAQEKAIKDNYLDILQLLPVSDEKVRNSGSSDFDLAIEKAQKCIKLHSITAKPKRKDGKTLTEEEKKWYDKNEYNPFLWHAWMMLADSQLQKGEFLEAAGTYSYIMRIYADTPEIVAMARMKTAQCYSELDWTYEAEELFSRLGHDSIPRSVKPDFASVKASHLIRQQRYEEAIPLLRQSIDGRKMSKTQKIRETFLLGQLYKTTENNTAAYRAFQKVIRMNPPYRVEFSARIQQTETMESASGKIEKKLKRMAKDPNNKDYLDQVYYALGNVWLARNDTVKALEAFETGLEEGTTKGGERGILLLTMATLYWERGEYADAQRCYSEAIGLIDRSNKQYDLVKLRSEVLESLVTYTDEIEYQDSLQHLATLPEAEVNRIIDTIIQELIEAEAEAERQAQLEEREANRAADRAAQTSVASNDGSWYFYNEALVKEGTASFRKSWGARKLEDNWRRSNKSVMASEDENAASTANSAEGTAENDLLSDAAADSTATEEVIELATDPHTREFYLQNIPYTEEQMLESDMALSKALLGAGIIYKDELEEYELAENVLWRTADDYPDFDQADDALYNLYLMYSLWGKADRAQECKDSLKARYPESDLTITICDPYFEENARYGKHREDSLYAVTYQAYLDGNTAQVLDGCKMSENRYPTGAHRAKFLFLEGAVQLQEDRIEEFLDILKTIVEKYPENEISQLAGLIAQGIHDGKILQSTSFSSIWDRRNGFAEDEAETESERPQFNPDRYQPYIFVLAYPADSLNENQLLFETARYNFSHYMMRNFEMEFRHEQGIGMLVLKQFLNFDEAYLYRQRLFEDGQMAARLEGLKALIITEENLNILLQHYSFNEYQEFYDSHFLDIPEFEIDGATLDEELEIEETEEE